MGQTALYVQFTGMHPDSGASWLYGPTFGIYQDSARLAIINLGFDVRGSILNGSGNDSLADGLVGVRGSVVPHVLPFKVYAEGLVGVARTDAANRATTNLQYQVNGGLEYTLLPRLDWRVVEAAWSGFSGSPSGYGSPFGLSTGIVLRLP